MKLIAEAWDAAGAYEVGSFSERRWTGWNGRYRDDVRRFWRGDDGVLGSFVSRLCGSDDSSRCRLEGLVPRRSASSERYHHLSGCVSIAASTPCRTCGNREPGKECLRILRNASNGVPVRVEWV